MRYNHIFNQAVSALSEGRLPDYNNCREEDVVHAFRSVFAGSYVDKTWLEIFIRKIHDESWGTLRAEALSTEQWPFLQVKGAVQYMKLVDARSGKVIFHFQIGPYRIPIRQGQSMAA